MSRDEEADRLRFLRRLILRVAHNAHEGHIASAFSILELVWALHRRIMLSHDRFILSKGHACLALYAVLADLDILPRHELDDFCKPGAKLLGHPERDPEHGIEATTGSLGHGCAMAVGMALARKIKNEPGRIFSIVGDGELNEGSCWEAAALADHFSLSNLVWIIDNNASSPLRIDGAAYQSDLASKFAAFGWGVWKIDGHSIPDIRRACEPSGGPRPQCIIARTIKGRGIARMEREPQAWHHRAPTDIELEEMLQELA